MIYEKDDRCANGCSSEPDAAAFYLFVGNRPVARTYLCVWCRHTAWFRLVRQSFRVLPAVPLADLRDDVPF